MGKSSSSSASTTKNFTKTDSRVNNQNLQGIYSPVTSPVMGVGDGARDVTLNVSDGGAVSSALSLTRDAGAVLSNDLGVSMEMMNDLSIAAIEAGNESSRRSAQLAVDMTKKSLDAYESVNRRALSSIDESNRRSIEGIGRAFSESTGFVKSSNADAMGTVRQVYQGAIGLVDRNSREFAQGAADISSSSMDFIENYTRSDDAINFQDLVKWGVLGVLGVTAVVVVNR